jgi:hypothetical protein
MITTLIISIFLTASFVGVAIWRMRALPDSISAMIRALRYKWLWMIWLWTVSALTLIPAISYLAGFGMEALGVGTLACLIFGSAMPLVDRDNTDKHWILSVSSCILSQLCVWFINNGVFWIWMFFPFFSLSSYVQPDGWLGKAMKGKGAFLVEIICYACLIVALLTI